MLSTPRTELPDWDTLPTASVELSDRQIQQALELTQTVADPTQQWPTYLSALARLGVQEWLAERAPDLMVRSSSANPAQLQVGDFSLHLLTTGSLLGPTIALPPDATPLLYVLVEVLEEQAQVRVCGYLRPDSLPLPIEIPIAQFTLDPNTLLLNLRCSLTPSLSPAPTPSLPDSPQPLLNTALWLRDRLDDVAQELAWVLLPNPFTSASALRSTSPFGAIAAALEARGSSIPPEARGAFRDFRLGPINLCLWAIVWALPDGWRLLLILSSQTEATLPPGVTFRVADDIQVLSEQTTQIQSGPNLYAEVEGSFGESFHVTIATPAGISVTLPPFRFDIYC